MRRLTEWLKLRSMRTLTSRPILRLLGAAVVVLVPAVLWLSGSALVVDETGSVQEAVIARNGNTEQKLYQPWSGVFYTIPKVEGTIEIRCNNGMRRQVDYITAGPFQTRLRLTGMPCEGAALTPTLAF